MIADQTILSECFAFFQTRATNLMFILSEQGQIIQANGYASSFTGRELVGVHIRDVFVDFYDKFEMNAFLSNPSEEYLLSVSGASGFPQSFYFTFKPVPGYILAFGRLDAEEFSALHNEMLALNSELSNLNRELNKNQARLQDALDHVKTLQGILPICMHCHQIRNDQEMWEKLETYLSKRSDAEFSHSICPRCAEKYYPDMDLYGD